MRTPASAASVNSFQSAQGISGLVTRRSTTPWSEADSSVASGRATAWRVTDRQAATASPGGTGGDGALNALWSKGLQSHVRAVEAFGKDDGIAAVEAGEGIGGALRGADRQPTPGTGGGLGDAGCGVELGVDRPRADLGIGDSGAGQDGAQGS